MMKQVRLILLLFLNLWVLLVPLSYRVFRFHDTVLSAVLKKPINQLTQYFFDLKTESILSSDSVSLYLWSLTLLLVAILLGIAFKVKFPQAITKAVPWLEKIAIYFLILQLMRYGFDKVFKSQFYLPEPNILATEMGQLDKDILFWCTMGSSYGYNIFLGMAELAAAALLLFKRTRVLGLLSAGGILLQILAINFSFDISVKLFSAILFLTTMIVLTPYLPSLWSFFIKGKSAQLIPSAPISWGKAKLPVKLVVLGLFLWECLNPYLATGNFNDDHAQRPFLHGTYINQKNNDPVKRIFFHRDGYLILENQKGEKKDYFAHMHPNTLILEDYQGNSTSVPYDFDKTFGILQLELNHTKYQFDQLNWRNAPLLQPQFHWTVDGGF